MGLNAEKSILIGAKAVLTVLNGEGGLEFYRLEYPYQIVTRRMLNIV